MARIVVLAAALLLSASTAEARWPRRYQQCQGSSCSTYNTYSYTYAYTQTTTTTATYQAATTDDPNGFVNWINNVRARYGLRALVWSADAAAHAAINSARGFGHSYLGGTRRQNVGMGSLASVEAGWLSSPAHLAAIVDPTVTEVGLANVNGVWTMNAR
jgi:uncharacterized protein YkwD